MEVLFAHTYLFLFGKLAVGGLLSLAVPPFFELERGFFRSTATVYLGAALLMALGPAYLRIQYAGSGAAAGSTLALALWAIFSLIFAAYYATLFVELPFLRARLFPLAVPPIAGAPRWIAFLRAVVATRKEMAAFLRDNDVEVLEFSRPEYAVAGLLFPGKRVVTIHGTGPGPGHRLHWLVHHAACLCLIRIGEINPLTGKLSLHGQEIHQGILYAVEEINAGDGLQGRSVKLISRDD